MSECECECELSLSSRKLVSDLVNQRATSDQLSHSDQWLLGRGFESSDKAEVPPEIFCLMTISATRRSPYSRFEPWIVRMIEAVWDLLGKKICLVFGRECGSACIWMVFSLLIRSLITFIGLEQYVPCGVVFALPYFIQVETSFDMPDTNCTACHWLIPTLWCILPDSWNLFASCERDIPNTNQSANGQSFRWSVVLSTTNFDSQTDPYAH